MSQSSSKVTITLPIPPDYQVNKILVDASPADVVVILSYGIDLFSRGNALTSKLGASEIARLDKEFEKKSFSLEKEYAKKEAVLIEKSKTREAQLETELSLSRASLASTVEETRLAVARSSEIAHAASAERIASLMSELREIRTGFAIQLQNELTREREMAAVQIARLTDELRLTRLEWNKSQRAAADTLQETTTNIRREIAADSRARIAELEAELSAAHAGASAAHVAELLQDYRLKLSGW